MKRKYLFFISAVILSVLGIYMIYLGSTNHIMPPVITGIGFMVIAFTFLGQLGKD